MNLANFILLVVWLATPALSSHAINLDIVGLPDSHQECWREKRKCIAGLDMLGLNNWQYCHSARFWLAMELWRGFCLYHCLAKKNPSKEDDACESPQSPGPNS